MSATTTTASKKLYETVSGLQNRKVSVPISMPQSLLMEIDSIRGDTPRSVFVCKILHVKIKKKEGEEEVHRL